MSDFSQRLKSSGLSIRNLNKFFASVQVLHDINLDVGEGEFVALVGPSGCGKSTLLRTIAGLEDISDGEVLVDGRVVNNVEPKDRDMAMVFQNYALYPHLSVRKNMGFSLSLRSVPRDETNRLVEQAAEILGLEGVLDRRPSQLSGGQRQRVAMGRAIVRQPRIFLFDEPLSNLDAKLRVKMRGEIKQLHQRFQTTTLYVTHDQVEAMTMADKVVVMKDGRVEQVGRPLDLYDWPANLFVAQFIGNPSMSILPGEMTDDGFILSDGQRLTADRSKKAARYLGIRPDRVRLSDSGISLQVDLVEPGGSDTFIAGKVGTEEFAAILPERLTMDVGEVLTLAPEADHLHYFDQEGKRLR